MKIKKIKNNVLTVLGKASIFVSADELEDVTYVTNKNAELLSNLISRMDRLDEQMLSYTPPLTNHPCREEFAKLLMKYNLTEDKLKELYSILEAIEFEEYIEETKKSLRTEYSKDVREVNNDTE